MRSWFLALALAGCAGAGGDDTGAAGGDGGGDGGGTEDSGEAPVEVFPTSTRVLMYYGHGGDPGEPTGEGKLEALDTRYGELGYALDWKDSLPEDAKDYRLIGLMGPGQQATEPWTDAQIALFKDAMFRGTRIAFLATVEMCEDVEVHNALFEALGVGVRLVGEGADQNQVIQVDQIGTHQLTEGVTALEFKDPCWVDPGSGVIVGRADGRGTVGAVERPLLDGNILAGDVVVLGDYQFLDDSGYRDEADNAALADNLVLIQP